MQMIDVLKRLYELDSVNPNVERVTVTSEQSLATFSNVENDTSSKSTYEKVAQALAEKGVRYSREKENEIIGMIPDELKVLGMPNKTITYLMNYDQDFIPDVLGSMPRDEKKDEHIGEAMKESQDINELKALAGTNKIDECGPMGMPSSSPASFSINATASSGDEVANMLTQIMNLAGMKPAAKEPAMMRHHEIELSPAHTAAVDTGDIGKAISIVDKMNGPHNDGKAGPVASMADEVRDMADELSNKREEIEDEGIVGAGEELTGEDSEQEGYDNSPDPKVEPHKYGDDQVKPRAQGYPHRVGDNPYEPTAESIAAQLLKDYQNFIKG